MKTTIAIIALLLCCCGPDDTGIIGQYCDFHSECRVVEGGFCNGNGWCTKYCHGDEDCPSDAVCRPVVTRSVCKPK